jgi:5-methylcytosine-specific restriction endonuclease McrA
LVEGNVLVLNRHYHPVHVTSVKRAFTLLYIGAARVIGPDYSTFDFDGWAELGSQTGHDVIHTVSRAICIPRVIILQMYDRLPKTKVRFSRINIYARDDNTCQYCGRKLPRAQLNLDHVIPRARGGRTTWENVVCCCVPCNLRKGSKLAHEVGMKLLKSPERPKWNPTFRAPNGRVTHREWLPFLGLVDASYWNTELVDED